MNITISSITDLPRYRGDGFTHIISLVDDGYDPIEVEELFEGYLPHRRLERQFDDVVYATQYYRAAELEDIEAILEFAKGFDEGSRVLVHCVAGISRSTAVGCLLLLQANPGMSIDEVFDEIVRIRPQARPNLLILRLGGQILGRPEIERSHKSRFSMVR